MKQGLKTLGILTIIIVFVWYKWKDQIKFNWTVKKAMITPSQENDAAVMDQMMVPQASLKDIPRAIGNWLEGFKRVEAKPIDETDYFATWRRNHPYDEE